jgi:flagellar biosynthesis/type III secretory pathway protein FliH
MFGIEKDFQKLMEQVYGPLSEPVKYETPMTEIEEEIEEVKAQIKVLEKKLSFLEELEKTKSPVEEAYKDWWGEYPGDENWTSDATRWQGFQAGYNAAYEEKVSEWEPTPQTPEQVADGLKEAFREAVKQGVVSSTKSPTLYDVIAEWWEYLEDTLNMENSIQDLVNDIEEWLPTEHETNSYKWNECIRMIRGKLR